MLQIVALLAMEAPAHQSFSAVCRAPGDVPRGRPLEPVYLGSVNLRPLMGGIRWSRPIRPRVAAELFAVTGYSFNGFDEAEDGEERPEGPRVVLPSSVSTVSNSWVWEAGARLWFELHPRVAFTTGLSYLRTRPSVTLLDGSQRSWDGDRVRIEAGIAFTLVKKRQ